MMKSVDGVTVKDWQHATSPRHVSLSSHHHCHPPPPPPPHHHHWAQNGLWPADPRLIVGMVQFERVNYSRLASHLRLSAQRDFSNYWSIDPFRQCRKAIVYVYHPRPLPAKMLIIVTSTPSLYIKWPHYSDHGHGCGKSETGIHERPSSSLSGSVPSSGPVLVSLNRCLCREQQQAGNCERDSPSNRCWSYQPNWWVGCNCRMSWFEWIATLPLREGEDQCSFEFRLILCHFWKSFW